jgi:hypothetical protein
MYYPGCELSAPPLPQVHPDGGSERAHSRPCGRTHPRAHPLQDVQRTLSRPRAHSPPLPSPHLHSHHQEQHEGHHEADQEDYEQGEPAIFPGFLALKVVGNEK